MGTDPGNASMVFAEFIMEGVERDLSRARRPKNAAAAFRRITTALKGTAKGSSLYEIVTLEKVTALKEKLQTEKPQSWDSTVQEALDELIMALEDDGEVELKRKECQESAVHAMRTLLLSTHSRCSHTSGHRLKHARQLFRIIFEYLCYVPFATRWRIGKQLGEGGHSTIRKCTHTYRYAGKTMALKHIHDGASNSFEIEMLRRETEVIRSLHHNHIPTVYDFDEEDGNLYLVLPLYRGGDMLERMVEKAGHNFTEDTCSKLIKDLIESVEYLHSVKVVHRDIKPENVIFENTNDHSNLYLIDFGFAAKEVEGHSLTTSCGTPQYAAPEILNGLPHGSEVDMWSVGVVTYLILAGYPPFYDDDTDEMFRLIKKGDLDFPAASWDNISEEAKNFIERLLTVDPSQRMTAEEAMNHAWIKSGHARRTDHLGFVQEEAKKFRARSMWQMQETIDKGRETFTIKNMRNAVNSFNPGTDVEQDLGLSDEAVRKTIVEDPGLRLSMSQSIRFRKSCAFVDDKDDEEADISSEAAQEELTRGTFLDDDDDDEEENEGDPRDGEITRLTRIIMNQRMEITSLNEQLELAQKRLREYERKEETYDFVANGENPMALGKIDRPKSFTILEEAGEEDDEKDEDSIENSEVKEGNDSFDDANRTSTVLSSHDSVSEGNHLSLSSNSSTDSYQSKGQKKKSNMFTRMVAGASNLILHTPKRDDSSESSNSDGLQNGEQKPVKKITFKFARNSLASQSPQKKAQKRTSIVRLGLHQESAVFYTLQELSSGAVESSIDPTRRELYLNDKDFQDSFGMTKDKFLGQSKWKQKKMKKDMRLF